MIRPIRLLSSFLTVGGWTLASRLLGFVRDIMIAGFLGSSFVAEAFLIAFSLPNMFRRFFGEGAFNTAFIPMFSKRVEAGADARGFAEDAFAGLATVLIGFTLLAQLAMPWLVVAMASGFLGDERFDMTVGFGRIAFPYILLISLAALLSGVLNSLGRFAAAAAAPVFLNVVMISAMALAHWAGGDIGRALVWAVPVGGVVQLVVVWMAARRAGMPLRLRRPRMTPELRRLAVIAAPAALAGGVVQVNLLIGRQVASYFDGAVAWLNYADRLYQLPLGVVGIAIGVVLLPDLSRRLQAGDAGGGRDSLNRAAEFTLLLSLPAAVALVLVPGPIISVLFERGAFDAADSAATAAATAIYGIGLPSFVLQKVLQPLYFAREDTRTPFRFAVVSMLVNAGLAIGLAGVLGFKAAAWGTTIAGWTMLALLWAGSRKMGDAARVDARLMRAVPRIALASAVMGAVLLGLDVLLADAFAEPGVKYMALLALVLVGALVYFGVLFLGGVLRGKDLRRMLGRRS